MKWYQYEKNFHLCRSCLCFYDEIHEEFKGLHIFIAKTCIICATILRNQILPRISSEGFSKKYLPSLWINQLSIYWLWMYPLASRDNRFWLHLILMLIRIWWIIAILSPMMEFDINHSLAAHFSQRLDYFCLGFFEHYPFLQIQLQRLFHDCVDQMGCAVSLSHKCLFNDQTVLTKN